MHRFSGAGLALIGLLLLLGVGCEGSSKKNLPPVAGSASGSGGAAAATSTGSSSGSTSSGSTSTSGQRSPAATVTLPGGTTAVPRALSVSVIGTGGTPPTPALEGRDLVVVGGHGYYYHETYGWTTQRGVTNGLIEDIHNAEIVNQWLMPAFQRAGARVFTSRCPDMNPNEVVQDAAPGAGFNETGAWRDGAGGFGGTPARVTDTVTGTPTAAIAFEPTFPEPGDYTVWVRFPAEAGRAPDARITILHSGGTSVRTVDQRRDGDRWLLVDKFHFSGTPGEGVAITNESAKAGKTVAIDGVRFGGGMGDIARGGKTSGQPRWKEGSRYWLETVGAPSWLTDASSKDLYDDRAARGLYPDWQLADAYISVHTNAGGGTGTSTFTADAYMVAGSDTLQDTVHPEFIRTIRQQWDAGWADRGKHAKDFSMFRRIQNTPAMLVEIAFHDKASPDAKFLANDRFRRDVARAYYKGVARYFSPGTPVAPLPPSELNVQVTGSGRATLSWDETADPLEPNATPVGYRVYLSPNGRGFDDGRYTQNKSVELSGLPTDRPVYVRVAAVNEGGESRPSEVLAVHAGSATSADVLVVSGFDRLDGRVTFRDGIQRFRSVVPHAEALMGAGNVAAFDSTTNEAVETGRVDLRDYAVVIWVLGEESTVDETFSDIEQTKVAGFLANGGGIFVSGAEIGWDLEARGSAADTRFFNDQLGAGYVKDKSGVYDLRPETGSIFDGLTAFTFAQTTKPVPYPDVLTVRGASRTALTYQGTGEAAAIQFDRTGAGRGVLLGFPFETIDDRPTREEVLRRGLSFLR